MLRSTALYSDNMRVIATAAFCLVSLSGIAAFSLQYKQETSFTSEVLRSYKRSAVFLDGSLATLNLAHVDASSPIVILEGSHKPARRSEDAALLSFAPDAAAAIPRAVQSTLLAGLQQVELLRGTRLFPVQIGTMPQQGTEQRRQAAVPWAVFEVSSGTLLLRQELLQLLQSTPVQASAVLVNACSASIQHVVDVLKQGEALFGVDDLSSVISKAAAAGVGIAFAAAVPKWFCFVCPVVLGLLAPLAINAGVGEAANMACKAWDLPDAECVDLWFAALGLGMVLSLLSAIPIFKVCRLYECAHPNGTRLAALA